MFKRAFFALILAAGPVYAQAPPTPPARGGTGSVTVPTAGQIMVGTSGGIYAPATASGDCTLAAAGAITCLKTSGVALTSAATTAIGTSGATIPLLNGTNTWANPQTFSGAGTGLAVTNNMTVGGHVIANGAAPALTSCGTTPAISGSDVAGLVTMGTVTPTGCVITFNTPYVSAPYCTVTWQATPLASQSYTVTNAAITLVQTATSSNKINYQCTAQSGG